MEQEIQRYLKVTIYTIGIVVFLVLVGGIVRSTGAGMGCPDWPKCFGMWVPPTCVCEVPEKYIVQYAKIGLTFNAVQTWIEYINRLIGALTGFFILATMLVSLPLRKINKWIPFLSFMGVILVGFEAWLGKKVVDSNLHEGMITIHMVGAMILLADLIIAYLIARRYQTTTQTTTAKIPITWIWLGAGISCLILIQIALGTQVRESVDVVARQLGAAKRSEWTQHLGNIYTYHKSFYYLVVFGLGYWLYQMKDFIAREIFVKRLVIISIALLVSEILLGIMMNYFAIPPFFQPVHLLFATVLFMATSTITIYMYQLNQSPVNEEV